MGYFSSLDLTMRERKQQEFVSDEPTQLLMRMEDLRTRLEELLSCGAPLFSGDRLSQSDLKFALPAELFSITDAMAALDCAKATLSKYHESNMPHLQLVLQTIDMTPAWQLLITPKAA